MLGLCWVCAGAVQPLAGELGREGGGGDEAAAWCAQTRHGFGIGLGWVRGGNGRGLRLIKAKIEAKIMKKIDPGKYHVNARKL